MFAIEDLPTSAPLPTLREELDYLYARRSVIDSLIESLEDYNRFRPISTGHHQRLTA